MVNTDIECQTSLPLLILNFFYLSARLPFGTSQNMKRKFTSLLFTCLLAFAVLGASGQTYLRKGYTRDLLLKIKKAATDTGRCNTLFRLSNYYLVASGDDKVYNDSAWFYLRQAVPLVSKTKSAALQKQLDLLYAEYYVAISDKQRGEAYFMRLINAVRKKGNEADEAVLWVKYADMVPGNDMADYAQKIKLYEIARQLYGSVGDKRNEAVMLSKKAMVYSDKKSLDTAEAIALQAKNIFKSAAPNQVYWADWVLASVYFEKNDFKKELSCLLEEEQYMSNGADDEMQTLCYWQLAQVYTLQGMDDAMLQWGQKGYKYCESRKLVDMLYSFVFVIANNMLRFKKDGPPRIIAFVKNVAKNYPPENKSQQRVIYELIGKAYVSINQFDKAEIYYRRLDHTFDHWSEETPQKDNADYANLLYHEYVMGQFFAKAKKFNDAALYVAKIDTLMPHWKKLPATFARIEQLKFKIDSSKGHYVAAINHLHVAQGILDSIFSAQKTRTISDLSIKYQTAQKEADIKLLKKQGIIEREKAQQANLQRNVTLVGIMVVIVMSGFIYYAYRQKQRSNRALEGKQQEINNQNVQLQKLVTDKDWLLKEVHHRVKNNLQIVMSLLNTQTAYLENAAALDAITESRNRVQTIALIHQKLYINDKGTKIHMDTYTQDLLDNLCHTFDTQRRQVRFDKMVDDIEMDIAQAVPVGLILNEAVTNAIKYAFTTDGGCITIALEALGNGNIFLHIADNGCGMPHNFDLKQSSTLGMELMKALTKQLGGTIVINSAPSVCISLEFQLEKIYHESRCELIA